MNRQISIFSLSILSFFALTSCDGTIDTTPPEIIDLFINTSEIFPLDTADLLLTTEAANLKREEGEQPPFEVSGELRDDINLLSYRVRVLPTNENPVLEGVLFPPYYELDTIVRIGGERVRIEREFPLTNLVAKSGQYDLRFELWDEQQLQAPTLNNQVRIINNSPEFHVTSIDRIPGKDSLFVEINTPLLIQGNVSDRDQDLKSGNLKIQYLERTLNAKDDWIDKQTVNFVISEDSAFFDTQFVPDSLVPHRVLFNATDILGAETEFSIPFSVSAVKE